MSNIVKQFRDAYRFPPSPVANEKRLARRVAEEWRHEQLPGTPIEFIVDEVLLCWSRNK